MVLGITKWSYWRPESLVQTLRLPQALGTDISLPVLGTPLVEHDGTLTPQGCGVFAGEWAVAIYCTHTRALTDA